MMKFTIPRPDRDAELLARDPATLRQNGLRRID